MSVYTYLHRHRQRDALFSIVGNMFLGYREEEASWATRARTASLAMLPSAPLSF